MHHIHTSLVALQNGYAELMRRQRDERGAALAEYGLLLALVALAAVAVLFLFGQAVFDVFTEAEQELVNRPSVDG